MEKQEMYKFFKQLVFDYYYGRKTKKETVHELTSKIDLIEGADLPNKSDEDKLLFNLYWDLSDLIHDPPFHTRDVLIEYYVDVFNDKRKFSDEDLHNYWVEKGIDDMYKLP